MDHIKYSDFKKSNLKTFIFLKVLITPTAQKNDRKAIIPEENQKTENTSR
jgi:hypothetical protein